MDVLWLCSVWNVLGFWCLDLIWLFSWSASIRKCSAARRLHPALSAGTSSVISSALFQKMKCCCGYIIATSFYLLLTLLDFCWLLTVFQSADLPDWFLEQGTFLVGQPSPQSSGKQLTPASVVQGSVGVGTSSTQGQALKVITGQKTALFTQVMCKWCVSLLLVLSDKVWEPQPHITESISFHSCLVWCGFLYNCGASCTTMRKAHKGLLSSDYRFPALSSQRGSASNLCKLGVAAL